MSGELDILLPANRRGTDILETIANLSSDEVFTPPWLVNEMLDMLEENSPGIFSDPSKTFLDPACKTGIFLREIARRLFEGLKETIPDPEERRRHILEQQVYGIAITELTALMSRRTLYCSKDASGKYSASPMGDPDGNIYFDKSQQHDFAPSGRCLYCGASKELFGPDARQGKEAYAYPFIHTSTPEDIFDMKFDVVVGNPPYQLNDGGAHASASPIYQHFVHNAFGCSKKTVMIIPTRWMNGGKGLSGFREEMMNDGHIREFHDFVRPKDCFTDVSVKGGICYFLRDAEWKGDTKFITKYTDGRMVTSVRPFVDPDSETIIRYSESISIRAKVSSKKEPSFMTIASVYKPYGLRTDALTEPEKYNLPEGDEKPSPGAIKVYGYRMIRWYPSDFVPPNHPEWVGKWKVLAPKAVGEGRPDIDRLRPLLAGPNEICTETYIVIGPFDTKEEAENCISYIETKFFHFLFSLRKATQDASRKVYREIPLVPMGQSWSDQMLFDRYGLSEDEKKVIETTIWPEGGEKDE